ALLTQGAAVHPRPPRRHLVSKPPLPTISRSDSAKKERTMTRAQWLAYLMQPGVIWTGLLGTALQLVLGVANNFNIAGIGDMVTHYGLSAHLASGGLIAVLTGLFYSMTERGS